MGRHEPGCLCSAVLSLVTVEKGVGHTVLRRGPQGWTWAAALPREPAPYGATGLHPLRVLPEALEEDARLASAPGNLTRTLGHICKMTSLSPQRPSPQEVGSWGKRQTQAPPGAQASRGAPSSSPPRKNRSLPIIS